MKKLKNYAAVIMMIPVVLTTVSVMCLSFAVFWVARPLWEAVRDGWDLAGEWWLE